MRPVARIKVICALCGNEFLRLPSQLVNGHGKFCSRDCANKAMENYIIIKCAVCGKEIRKHPSKPTKQFCSKKCMGIAERGYNRKKKTGKYKACSFCGKQIYVQKSNLKGHNFCSNQCQVDFFLPSRTGENSQSFINGATINGGYAKLYSKKIKRRVLAHRLIAEQVLRRPLKEGEIVHHIDGNKLNNENNNLLICTNSYHIYLHHLMRRCDLGKVA